MIALKSLIEKHSENGEHNIHQGSMDHLQFTQAGRTQEPANRCRLSTQSKRKILKLDRKAPASLLIIQGVTNKNSKLLIWELLPKG